MRSEVWSNQFKNQVNMVLPELRSFKLFKLISSAWDRSDYKMIRLGKIWQRNRQKGVNWVLVTAHRDQALIGSWNVYFLSDLSDMWGKLEFISRLTYGQKIKHPIIEKVSYPVSVWFQNIRETPALLSHPNQFSLFLWLSYM